MRAGIYAYTGSDVRCNLHCAQKQFSYIFLFHCLLLVVFVLSVCQPVVLELQRLFAEMQAGPAASVSPAPLMSKLQLNTALQQDVQEYVFVFPVCVCLSPFHL